MSQKRKKSESLPNKWTQMWFRLIFEFLFLHINLMPLHGHWWLKTQENRALGKKVNAPVYMVCSYTAGPFYLINQTDKNTQHLFPTLFPCTRKGIITFKTWEQEVYLSQPCWGRRQGWPLAPCLFSSALRKRYLQFTPWQWPFVSCLTDRTWHPPQFTL